MGPNLGLWWITGAGSGIGRALALQMATAGAKVVISGRSAAALQETAAGRENILPAPLDISDGDAVRACIASIEQQHGPLTGAVLGAAQYRAMDLADFSATDFAQLIETNLLGTVNCLEPLLKRMMTRGAGQIAVIASVAGYRGLPKAAAYGASKAALINLLESLRPSAGVAGIKLQVINPGFVKTPMTSDNDFPMPFMISPEEAGRRIVAGLATDSFEITFPRRFAFFLKLGRILPYRLYFAVTRRMIGA